MTLRAIAAACMTLLAMADLPRDTARAQAADTPLGLCLRPREARGSDRTIDICTQALQTAEGEPRGMALLARALALVEQGNSRRAIPDLEEAERLAVGAHKAMPNMVLGLIYGQAGDDDRGISCLSDAIRYDPHLARAYAARGALWKKKGDAARAQADFDAARRERGT